MRITKVTIEKFRAIRFSEIELSQETALVGQNSAGKSSILRALNAFFNFRDERDAFEAGRHCFQKTTTSIITLEFTEIPADCNLARISANSDMVRARLKYRRQPIWQIFDNGNWVSATSDFHQLLSEHIRYV